MFHVAHHADDGHPSWRPCVARPADAHADWVFVRDKFPHHFLVHNCLPFVVQGGELATRAQGNLHHVEVIAHHHRNRFTAERRLTIRSYHPGAYASAEFFYQSQYAKWSATHLIAGCLFPLNRHIQLDTYYEHANNTGPHPNQQVNAAGLIIDLYFPPSKH